MIERAIRDRRKAVIPYVTAGLPDLDTTGRILVALEEAGAAAIEIGIPFSDPMADGPVLQQASHLALQAGFKMDALQERLKGWNSMLGIPLIIMSYMNPLMRRGFSRTMRNLRESGVCGAIIPDLPRDAGEIYAESRAMGMDLIRMVAPTTTPGRAREILSQCSGFVYAVSVKGVTGTRSALPTEVRSQVDAVREMTDLPVCVGFGVSCQAQVDELLGFADGVIVGSHLMAGIMSSPDPVSTAREALRGLAA